MLPLCDEQVGLSIALIFTFPTMMHPIHEIVEAKLWSNELFQKLRHNIQCAEWLGLHGSRILVVAVLAVLASFIPGFSTFISFVGSTGCALLSFVLPAAFHLFIMGHTIGFWQRALDYGILITGLAFAGYGTYDVFASHSSI